MSLDLLIVHFDGKLKDDEVVRPEYASTNGGYALPRKVLTEDLDSSLQAPTEN
jgi:hypothetical protein